MDKKIVRKQKRFQQRLSTKKNIKCTEIFTNKLLICNIGQATGVQKEKLQELLIQYIQTKPKIILCHGETYTFLLFDNIEQAKDAYNKLNGIIIYDGGAPLCLIFVEDVPETECLSCTREPEGLKIIEDFISLEEERDLIELFDRPLDRCLLKNRQVWHYGFEFRYGSNDVDLACPLDMKIPEDCDFLWERMKKLGMDFIKPDQLTVNKYISGQGIPSHVDTHSPFEECIIVISLNSSVIMDWKHHSGVCVPVYVPNRSLLIMAGDARYDWLHGIQARTWDPLIKTSHTNREGVVLTTRIVSDVETPRGMRISLTFRKTRSGPCLCRFHTLCDSRRVIDNEVASMLEDMHVHKVYDKIASHFSTTRHKAWPKVVEFVNSLPCGAVLLDLGSGNGKNISKRNDIIQVAIERSDGLINECRVGTHMIGTCDCIRSDMLYVPMLDECCDACICIAVIHHFSNKERRIQAIGCIARLLRKNGTALITVWAKDQSKANYLAKNKLDVDIQDEKINCVQTLGVSLPVHENRTQFKHNDLLVPWKLREKDQSNKLLDVNETLLRFYHVFEEGELVELCTCVKGIEVVDSFYCQGNWCVVVKKL